MNKMNVFKTVIEVIEVIDGVEKEFVMIELNEYNYYMLLTNPLYENMAAKEKRQFKRNRSKKTLNAEELKKLKKETEEKKKKKLII